MDRFILPLPFKKNSLVPYMSEETIEFHYFKHYKNYVNNLNILIKNTRFYEMSLENILLRSDGNIFNNASQSWNHTFFWKCLSPIKNFPKNRTLFKINNRWGSFDNFKKKFSSISLELFGSGWVWLIQRENDILDIVSTSNANNPIVMNLKPILVLDVWEHAYYIDYRNSRINFINSFWNIINWDFVENNII